MTDEPNSANQFPDGWDAELEALVEWIAGLDGETAVRAVVLVARVDLLEVGRAGRAFALQARHDACVVGIDTVDADAGGLGEVGVKRFVGLVVAR